MNSNFYYCNECKNVCEILGDKKASLFCCGQKMELLKANSTDAATEKHVPALTREGNILKVAVGSVLHPMTAEHHIAFIYVAQDNKVQRVELDKTGKPEAIFTIDDGPVKVYEYCNLHGLWVAEI